MHIKADQLIIPPVFEYIPSKWAVQMLREQLYNHSNNSRNSSKLYISKCDARTRRVLNEDELMKDLAPLGFKRVTLRGMSVEEQCNLFRSADFIVAPHGA